MANWSCCPIGTCCWFRRKRVNWRWSGRPPISSRSSRGSRRSTARPGTTRCWPATSCWFATARRCRIPAVPRGPLTGWPPHGGDPGAPAGWTVEKRTAARGRGRSRPMGTAHGVSSRWCAALRSRHVALDFPSSKKVLLPPRASAAQRQLPGRSSGSDRPSALPAVRLDGTGVRYNASGLL